MCKLCAFGSRYARDRQREVSLLNPQSLSQVIELQPSTEPSTERFSESVHVTLRPSISQVHDQGQMVRPDRAAHTGMLEPQL